MEDAERLSAVRAVLSGVLALGTALEIVGKEADDGSARDTAVRLLSWYIDLDLPPALPPNLQRKLRRIAGTAKLLRATLTADPVDLVTVRAAVARLKEVHPKLERELLAVVFDLQGPV